MFKELLSIIIFSFSFALCGQNVQELIEKGDRIALKDFENQRALETFLKAEKLEPNNYEVLWRISRSYVDIAEHMPDKTDSEKEAQLTKYETALGYAEKAIKIAPDQSVNYLRRAIVNGRIALFKGVFSAISLVNKVKEDCEKAIKLNNGGKEIMSVVYYVLGRTHLKVCEKSYLVRLPLGLGWGDMDKSISNLKKAIELRPSYRMYHFELAKAYVEEGEEELAISHLYKIQAMPFTDEDDGKVLKESKELLKSLQS